SQLRYDLAKLRAKDLVQRVGRTRRYRLTPQGAKLGVLLIKLRFRLIGPLATLATRSTPDRPPLSHNLVDAAFHQVDSALDQLCAVPRPLTRSVNGILVTAAAKRGSKKVKQHYPYLADIREEIGAHCFTV